MKTTLDFLEQVAQFRHSEFLHRLDIKQTREVAKEAMALYADYKNKDLLLQIKIHEQRIVILRQLMDKAGLSEITAHDGSEVSGTTFDQWMTIICGLCSKQNIKPNLNSKNWKYMYDLGYSAGDAIEKIKEYEQGN